MHLLKLALRPWKLAFWSQAFSVSAVAFLLLGTALLLWMERGLAPLVTRLQKEQVITAYLAPDLDPSSEKRVIDQISTSLGARVESVTPPEFIQELKNERHEELARQLEDLGPELESVVPRYVTATGLFGRGALDRVRAIEGVDSAESSLDRFAHVAGAFAALRWVARAIAAGLLLSLLTGLIHLSRANAQIHREAIALLRLWGAGPLAVRFPAVFSGIVIGMAGGVIAAASWYFLSREVAGHLAGLSPMLSGLAAPHAQGALGLALAGLGLGWIAGMAGVPARSSTSTASMTASVPGVRG